MTFEANPLLMMLAPQIFLVAAAICRFSLYGRLRTAASMAIGALFGTILLLGLVHTSQPAFGHAWGALGWPNVLHIFAIAGFVVVVAAIAYFWSRLRRTMRCVVLALALFQGAGIAPILLDRVGFSLAGQLGFHVAPALAMIAIVLGGLIVHMLPAIFAIFACDLTRPGLGSSQAGA